MKNWEFDKAADTEKQYGGLFCREAGERSEPARRAAQILYLERATIVERQGASEDPKFAAKPTQSKTDSSFCLCIIS